MQSWFQGVENCITFLFNVLSATIFCSVIHCYQLTLQIGLCPEASGHLQELKDRLISISNDLLDNVNNLSPVQIDKLRQERFAIQYLIYL